MAQVFILPGVAGSGTTTVGQAPEEPTGDDALSLGTRHSVAALSGQIVRYLEKETL